MTERMQKLTADVAAHRSEIIDKLVQYSLTDMLFFWSNEEDLIKLQETQWQPLLNWAKAEFETRFEITHELNVPEQQPGSGIRLRLFMEHLSDKELAAFYVAATNTRSVLLAAALVKGRINAEQAFKAAFLEELYQAEAWGPDEEAEKKRGEMKQELLEVEKFLKN